MSTPEIKVTDPIYLQCINTNSQIPGIVREVFERRARVELARQKGRRWLFEHREVELSALIHRPGEQGSVDLRDFQVC
ncbi:MULTISPECIES: hypothetical protein [Pseudomonas]|uniref:hypothetical protein n=1 Tax=Pseudomonas TaxID=286 RepID=UPI000F03C113|nr:MULTISPECIES: hypothetical protein [Pseudomonas]MBD8614714.1 hypothetical protein [Pseudomonas putida]MBD8681602.1 hypothetical protein [Pseudomonas sp. CFBP 13719]